MRLRVASVLIWLGGPRWRDWRSPDLWLLMILVGAIAARWYYLNRTTEWLVGMFVADDFFYYAGTAWNVAAGYGSSCDYGVTHHNGFHPLYLVTLLATIALGVSKYALVKVGLGILCVATVLAVSVSYRVGRELGATWSALCVPIALAYNNYFVRMSLHGLETALVVLFVLATALACLRKRPAWEIGLWLGVACLARIDVAMFAVAVAWHIRASRGWRDLATVVVISAIVVSPWVAWSFANFGVVSPLSGTIKMNGQGMAGLSHGLQLVGTWVPLLMFGDGLRDYVASPVLYATGIVILFATARSVASKNAWLLVYGVVAWAVYSWMTDTKVYPQLIRYMAPSLILWAIVAFCRPARSSVMVPIGLLLIVVGADARFVSWAHSMPTNRNFQSLSQSIVPGVLDSIATPEDVIGCYDSGAISFYASQPVVNLDGLVNADVVKMLREPGPGTPHERYARYLNSQGITILVGGTAFYWPNYFPTLESWETLAPPIEHPHLVGQIVFLRVPPDLGSR